MPPRWGERQALTFLYRFDNMFLIRTMQPKHDTHVAPLGLGWVGIRHFYKHARPAGAKNIETSSHHTHCAPLERGGWTHRHTIDMPPRWGERQALTFLYRFDNMFWIRTMQPKHDTHVAPLGRKTGGDIALCSQNTFWIRTMTPRHDTHAAPLGL